MPNSAITIIETEAKKLQQPPVDKFQLAHQYIQIKNAQKLLKAYQEKIQEIANTLFIPDEQVNNYIWKVEQSTRTQYKNTLDQLYDNLPEDAQVLATELLAHNKTPTTSKYFKEVQ